MSKANANSSKFQIVFGDFWTDKEINVLNMPEENAKSKNQISEEEENINKTIGGYYVIRTKDGKKYRVDITNRKKWYEFRTTSVIFDPRALVELAKKKTEKANQSK